MPAQNDIKGKIMGQKRLLEELETIIPGFSGYKEKELRRESDKLLREMLAGKLNELNTAVEGAYSDIVESKITSAYETMNAATALMDMVIAKVESGDYGYAGFFDAIKIREDALDEVYDYDKKLFADVDALTKKVEKLAEAIEDDENDKARGLAKELKKAIMDFDKKLDRRKAVMMKLE